MEVLPFETILNVLFLKIEFVILIYCAPLYEKNAPIELINSQLFITKELYSFSPDKA